MSKYIATVNSTIDGSSFRIIADGYSLICEEDGSEILDLHDTFDRDDYDADGNLVPITDREYVETVYGLYDNYQCGWDITDCIEYED